MHAVAETTIEERIRRLSPVAVPPEEQRDVVELRARLADCKLVDPAGNTIPIPQAVFRVLERVVEVMARGDAITIVPVGKEMTTQQAANILNVSRQYLVRLLDDRQIPYTKTGKHRRLRVEDVLRFKAERDAARRTKLDELTGLSEDIGYDELK